MAVGKMLHEAEHRPSNVVSVLDVTSFGGMPTLVLEGFDSNFWDWMYNLVEVHDGTKDGTTHACKLFCSALADAALGIKELHQKGIVHHDIKPANILVSVRGSKVKAAICDFESIGIPYGEDSPAHDWLKLHDGGRHKSDDRWFCDWEYYKWSDAYAHPRRTEVSPWCLDGYSLSVIINKGLDAFSGSMEANDMAKVESVQEKVLDLLRENAPESLSEACKRLDQVSGLLRNYAEGD